MKVKNVLTKTGEFVKKHKNIELYIGGLMLVVYGLMSQGHEDGFKDGVEYFACRADEVEPGFCKKLLDHMEAND